MTVRDKSFMESAKNEADKSDFKQQTGCVVVYKGSIISTGHNTHKTHPAQYKYNKYRFSDINDDVIPKIHAEVMALNKIKYLDIDFSKVKIYVYRKRRDKDYGIARPCSACMKMIKDMGISRIYYSTDYSIIYEEIIDV